MRERSRVSDRKISLFEYKRTGGGGDVAELIKKNKKTKTTFFF